jgi:transposase
MKSKSASKVNSVSIRSDVFLGIDLHQSTTVIAAIDSNGRLRSLVRIPTTGRELVNAITSVRAIRPAKKKIAIEETPLTHWAIDILRPWCDSVISCDPKQNRWISRNSQKNDEQDAERLARLLRLGELKEVFHTDDPQRYAFKAAVQHYHDVQKDHVRAKNKIKAHFRRMGKTTLCTGGGEIFAKKYRKVLLDVAPPGPWRMGLERRFCHYDWLHQEVALALREVTQLGQAYWEVAQFRRIPGVGPVVSNTVSAYLQTPHRFTKTSSLYRYAALAITNQSSDGKPLGYQRLERGVGCPELKSMTYHAWLGAISAKSDNEVKRYHQAALAENGGNATRARLTTQRKILATMWALWRNKTPYDPAWFVHSYEKESQP